MNKKDAILLYEIGNNSRASYSQLAKATKISQETVRYRIKQLTEEKIIKKFIMLSNSRLLGYSFYQIFLKLQNAKESDRQEIVNYLKNESCTAWVANFEGRFDIGFIVIVENQTQLQDIVEKIYREFGQKIMQKALSFQLSAEFFSRDYLIDMKKHIKKKRVYDPIKEKIKIDSKDMQICLGLSQDARKSFVEIGTKLKISADAVAKRVRILEKKGLITGYDLDIDESKIGYLRYKILLRMNNLSPSQTNSILYKVRSNPNTTAFMAMLADWDYEIDIEVENVSQVREFIMDLTSDNSNLVKDYDILRITDVQKYNFFPNIEKQD